MRIRRALSLLGAIFAAIALCAAAVSPAAAATSTTSRSLSPASAQGVGVGTWVDGFRTLYQCPANGCNQGQAYPGNDLADVCTWQGWDLVYNRANGHTGFIARSNLGVGAPRSNQDCNSVGHKGGVYVNDTIRQCPSAVCNAGQAFVGNDIGVICYVTNATEIWFWVLNHANGHEGFILYLTSRNLHWEGAVPPC
ncbi:hypothetical protein [Streptomyces pseudovenezuelae]|uniref:SH3 domain-containing protein n=1 Tax=Streptomyces pseudovenezuelae TaxID=67350 RepID=A0ABT6M1D1_9ACTN|nr:hypothetical protein [Streptomyces pseudovenezuelae]MDH6221786.1 hypothetical protein [Streptomyces pseudovenezuelae]